MGSVHELEKVNDLDLNLRHLVLEKPLCDVGLSVHSSHVMVKLSAWDSEERQNGLDFDLGRMKQIVMNLKLEISVGSATGFFEEDLVVLVDTEGLVLLALEPVSSQQDQ